MSEESFTASQKFEEEAGQWEESGELGWSGQNDYAFVKLRLWSWSDGAKKEGISDRLRRYIVAAEAPFLRRGPEWYEDFLQKRDY